MEAVIGSSTFKDNKTLLKNKLPRDIQNRDLTDDGDSDTVGKGVIDIAELKENSEQLQ